MYESNDYFITNMVKGEGASASPPSSACGPQHCKTCEPFHVRNYSNE